MQQAYLLVEGINIYPNVFDTDQLSVIRGSSFALKGAINHIKDRFGAVLEPVTTGASSGLFLVKGEADTDRLIADISSELERSPYCYFTFAVEYCRAEDLLQAKEQLLAQLRFHQLSGISTVPDRFTEGHGRRRHPCQLEGRRIAAEECRRKVQVGEHEPPRQLSLSVCERLDYGRNNRQDFYKEEEDAPEWESLSAYSFTDDLENLAGNSPYRNLNDKVAVVYMDGNKFGAIQNEILQGAKDKGEDLIASQKRFDEEVKGVRGGFLRTTLLEMAQNTSHRYPNAITQNADGTDAIRFETLLWGGDEMLFVLPAWSGFELLQSFFVESAKWKIGGHPLTHAAGIVFCHARTPIRITCDIARSLADTIKNQLGDQRRINTWDYMVLESIDYPVNRDIDDFNKGRYGEALARQRPLYFPPSTDWLRTKQQLEQLITGDLLSRRQLFRIVDAFGKPGGPSTLSWSKLADSKRLDDSASPQESMEHRMLMLLDREKRRELAETLPPFANQLFGIEIDHPQERAWLWLNLIELWDYLVPME